MCGGGRGGGRIMEEESFTGRVCVWGGEGGGENNGGGKLHRQCCVGGGGGEGRIMEEGKLHRPCVCVGGGRGGGGRIMEEESFTGRGKQGAKPRPAGNDAQKSRTRPSFTH